MTEENMTDSTDSVKNMRDKIERQEKELKELRSAVKTNLFKEVGLPTDSGVGKMAFELYNGSNDTAELNTWLNENYGIGEAQLSNEQVAAQKISESDQKLQQVQNVSQSIAPPSIESTYREVVDNGTVKESIRAKLYMQDNLKNQTNN